MEKSFIATLRATICTPDMLVLFWQPCFYGLLFVAIFVLK